MKRREFIKTSAAGAAVLAAVSCSPKKSSQKQPEANELGEMTVRINPKTSEKVGLLGYGCMRWPMKKDQQSGKDVIDQEEVNRLVDYAIEHGVNYFDTAPVYLQGQSEAATAKALSRYPRESYFIATKLSNFGSNSFNDGVAMYKRSLELFGTSYLDYYLLHSLNGAGAFNKRFVENGLIDFLLEEREKGNIRNLGFSFHGDTAGFDSMMALHEQYHWDFVQIQMNYIDWTHASGRNSRADYLYSELEKRGIPVVIMEPLLGGRLSNVPDHIAEQFLEMEPSRSVASWAFRFCGTSKGVLTVLSGMKNMDHLQDNLLTFCPLDSLENSELEFLEKMAGLISAYPTIPCNSCDYCMPCPYGLDIPGIFNHYNKCVNEGLMAKDPEESDYRKLRRAYLVGYDRAVPLERQASRCTSCGKCLSTCPQRIKIPQQMSRIDKYVEELKKNI